MVCRDWPRRWFVLPDPGREDTIRRGMSVNDHTILSGPEGQTFTHRHQFVLIGIITLATVIAAIVGGLG